MIEESYTFLQTMYYYRFTVLNVLVATLVILSFYLAVVQTASLTNRIIKDKREFKNDNFRCDNTECNERKRCGGDSISISINKSFNTEQSYRDGGDKL